MPKYNVDIEPFFLESTQGTLFCIYYHPKAVGADDHTAQKMHPSSDLPCKGGILYLHPFAEEMHKSRRMAAIGARHFAASGYAVLQVDLSGCGDSAGDFSDATIACWLNDARTAYDWLAGKISAPISLWGLRTGASLAVQLACTLPAIEKLWLWQPVINGELFLNQFLRIKLASEMLSQGQAQNGTKELRRKLDSGEYLEIGGYKLNPLMAQQLSILKLGDYTPACPVAWLEVGSENSESATPASLRIIDTWRNAGVTIQVRTVAGDPFWLTQEITECANLIEAT
jgi:exosortase A-associated hydrolase 2